MTAGATADRTIAAGNWRRFRNALVFLLLTVLTQIGGIAFLAVLVLPRFSKTSGRPARLVVFLGLYAAVSVFAHTVAPVFGRVPLPCFNGAGGLQLQSPLYCLLNRNYVTVGTERVAVALSNHMAEEFPGTVTSALDANFPFFNGFPLLPHLSHDDGRKLDMAFYYRDETNQPVVGKTRSAIGYFAFEQPQEDAVLPCADRQDVLTFRWNLEFLQPFFAPWSLDEARTAAAIRWLSSDGKALGVEKIFVEPHLARKLAVENDSVRFQGCRAARHDDHIHFQVAQ